MLKTILTVFISPAYTGEAVHECAVCESNEGLRKYHTVQPY
jgi:hypothetical protein